MRTIIVFFLSLMTCFSFGQNSKKNSAEDIDKMMQELEAEMQNSSSPLGEKWLEGKWVWVESKDGMWFDLNLQVEMIHNDGTQSYIGSICSGVSDEMMRAVDCCGQDEKGKEVVSIRGMYFEEADKEKIDMSFTSCFGFGKLWSDENYGSAQITKVDNNTIKWKITEQPKGGCSIPVTAILKRQVNEKK